MTNIKSLYEQRGGLHDQMKDIAEQVQETDSTSTVKGLTKRFDALDLQLAAIDTQIRTLESEELKEAKSAVPVGSEYKTYDNKNQTKDMAAFDDYLRHGSFQMKQENIDYAKRANQFYVGTDSKGGYTVSEEMAKQVAEAQAEIGGLLSKDLCYWFKTKTGGSFKLPAVDDTSNDGYLIAEKTNLETSAADMTLEQITFEAYKYTSGLVRVSNELLQDANFDFASWLVKMLSLRLYRALNTAFTTGTGSSQPQGVITGAHKGEDAVKRGITRDDILNLYHSVDPAYRKNAKFMMNDATLKIIKAMINTATYDSSPLWQTSMRVGEPETMEGKEFIINQSMDDVFPTKKPLLFGDFKRFGIREVLPLKIIRLDERFADTDETGFAILGRYDSHVMTPSGSYPFQYARNATT